MTSTKISTLTFCSLALLTIACHDALAEKRPLSKQELKNTATDIVVGKIQAVYSRQERAGNYEYTRYVAEVSVQQREKGEGPKDLIYVRYFTIGWKGPGPMPPGPGGHWPRPEKGKSYRFYLAKNAYDGFTKTENQDGGYNVIYGNGAELLSEPSEKDGAANADPASTLPRVKALLESGRDAKALPPRIAIRVHANASDQDKRLEESWEFSAGQVHRLVVDASNDRARYRREKSLAFDTAGLCRVLLDGKLFEIEEGEGTGDSRLFAGTEFEGGVGSRRIEILVDGQSEFWVGESCLFPGFPESDALAFSALYEHLASPARLAFANQP